MTTDALSTAFEHFSGSFTWTIVALHLGIITHLVKKVIEIQVTDSSVGLTDYFKRYRYQCFMTLMASIIGYVGLITSHELTLLTAFMAGYMANSLTGK